MGVTALVMAGGKGIRMRLGKEKLLLKVGGRPMIGHVLNALKNARKVNEIMVAVSKHTPKTAKMVGGFSLKVLETPGKDYVSDMQYAIKKLKLSKVLTISADLPLITGRAIDEVIEYYERCGKPALLVAVPIETRERLGLEADYAFEAQGRHLVPSGINMINGGRIDDVKLEEEVLIVDKEEIAMNVNTIEDLKIARRLFRAKQRRNLFY